MICEASHLFRRTNAVVHSLRRALDVLGCRLPREAVIHLPYCWHNVPNTTDMVLLNREYRPIGVAGDWVNYADHPELMAPRHMVHSDYLTAAVPSHTLKDVALRTMFCNPGPDPRRWFFNDATDPRRGKKYRQRLAGLIQDNLDVLEDLP